MIRIASEEKFSYVVIQKALATSPTSLSVSVTRPSSHTQPSHTPSKQGKENATHPQPQAQGQGQGRTRGVDRWVTGPILSQAQAGEAGPDKDAEEEEEEDPTPLSVLRRCRHTLSVP